MAGGNQQLAFAVRAVNEASKTLKEIQGDLDATGASAGKSGGLLDKFGISLGSVAKTAAVATAAVGVAAVGLGAAALKFGDDFDAAYDTIRVGTGATGEALRGLEKDFKAVVSDVPVDFEKASVAIADLNTRTGQTGKGLQDLSKQVLNLSRITGTDVAQNVADASRFFGDWSISTEDQTEALDQLFRASQYSGIGINELSQKLVAYGAPLRQFNFSTEEAIALMSKWEKEGVNTELVLGSLRIAMGKFAKDGIPMREGLQDTIDKIQALGPGAEATSLAMETFGARAGPDMAAAILEGRFEIDEYLAAVKDGADTINQAASETDDWREKLTQLRNRALVKLEAPIMAVFNGVGQLLDVFDSFSKYIGIVLDDGDTLNDYLEYLPGPLQDVAKAVGEAAVFFKDDLVPAVRDFGETALPVIKQFAEDVLGALRVTLERDVIPKVTELWSLFNDYVVPVLEEAGTFIRDTLFPALQSFGEWLSNHKEVLVAVVAGVVAYQVALAAVAALQFAQTVIGMVQAFNAMRQAVGLATAVQTLFNVTLAANPIGIVVLAIAGLVAAGVLLYKNWDTVTEKAGQLWEFMKEAFGGIAGFLRDRFFDFLDSKFAWLALLLGPVGVLVAVYKFRDEIVDAFNTVKEKGGQAWDLLADGVKGSANLMIGFANGVIGAFESMVNGMGSAINSIPSFSVPGWVPKIGGAEFSLPDVPRLSLGRIPALARGGVADGFAWVGEEGPELAYFGDRARVYSASDSRDIASSGASVNFYGPVTIEARDASEARRSADSIGVGFAMSLRARGAM